MQASANWRGSSHSTRIDASCRGAHTHKHERVRTRLARDAGHVVSLIACRFTTMCPVQRWTNR